MQARACWCMTVKLRGREGKEMHGGENDGKKMHEKRNRGQRNQGQGAVATTTTRRPRGGAKGRRPEAKDLCAKELQLKVYGPQANRSAGNGRRGSWIGLRPETKRFEG